MDDAAMMLNEDQLSEIEDFAHRGSFHSTTEVIDAALSALRERFADDQFRMDRFHALIDEGLKDLDEGRYETVPMDKLGEWLDGLTAEAR